MNRKTASSALSALFFAQGLLGVGALAAILLRDPVSPPVVAAMEVPAAAVVR